MGHGWWILAGWAMLFVLTVAYGPVVMIARKWAFDDGRQHEKNRASEQRIRVRDQERERAAMRRKRWMETVTDWPPQARPATGPVLMIAPQANPVPEPVATTGTMNRLTDTGEIRVADVQRELAARTDAFIAQLETRA